MSDGEDIRVLSIQSSVVRGYVGNRAAIVPLTLHGIEMDMLNSCQLCNHTGYRVFQGQVLNDSDLKTLYEGLKANGIPSSYQYLLTGYVGNDKFLKQIEVIMNELKGIKLFCDPVLGDNGKFYCPEECVPVYRNHILPHATLATPNQFELEKISGKQMRTESDIMEGIEMFHQIGPSYVVVTSSDLGGSEKIVGFASSLPDGGKRKLYRFQVERLDAIFVGTGDVFTSTLLVWMERDHWDLKSALRKTLITLQTILKRTLAHAQKIKKGDRPTAGELELRLVQSADIILNPTAAVDKGDASIQLEAIDTSVVQK